MLRDRVCFIARVVCVATLLATVSAGAEAESGRLERVSVGSAGEQADGECLEVALSPDGRFIAFSSTASNLVAQDRNNTWDVFVRDTVQGTTERVSLAADGTEARGACGRPAISADGRFVLFVSEAPNIVPGDTNESQDVFLRDRLEGKTEILSVSWEGKPGNGESGWYPSITPDGRYVTFVSAAQDLVQGDDNSRQDVFVRDRAEGKTEIASVAGDGQLGKSASGWMPQITPEGRFVAFASQAVNLVQGDENQKGDVFVRDRSEQKTERVSLGAGGAEADADSGFPRISADARFVAFVSEATNLVEGDTNGKQDVFLRDRAEGKTYRVSVSRDGEEGADDSGYCAMSACGRWIAFHSMAPNLVPGDENGKLDVFLRDREGKTTVLLSANASGKPASGDSVGPVISADGRYLAFVSDAADLVEGDSNGVRDVFLWRADASQR